MDHVIAAIAKRLSDLGIYHKVVSHCSIPAYAPWISLDEYGWKQINTNSNMTLVFLHDLFKDGGWHKTNTTQLSTSDPQLLDKVAAWANDTTT